MPFKIIQINNKTQFAQSAGAVEYTLAGPLQREKTPLTSVLDMTLNNQMVRFQLELWGMRSTPSLPLLPGRLWPGVVAPDRALSLG